MTSPDSAAAEIIRRTKLAGPDELVLYVENESYLGEWLLASLELGRDSEATVRTVGIARLLSELERAAGGPDSALASGIGALLTFVEENRSAMAEFERMYVGVSSDGVAGRVVHVTN